MTEFNPKIPTNTSFPFNLRKQLDELARERDTDRSALITDLVLKGLEAERAQNPERANA